MNKTTFCICENKGADQLCSNCEVDQRRCFRYTYSKVTLPFQPLAIVCASTARFMSDLVGSHIVDFLMTQCNVAFVFNTTSQITFHLSFQMSRDTRKQILGDFDLLRQKTGCVVTQEGQKFEI